VIHEYTWTTTDDILQHLIEQRRVVGTVLENDIKRLLMLRENRLTQFLNSESSTMCLRTISA
jgi:hypothetical protein